MYYGNSLFGTAKDKPYREYAGTSQGAAAFGVTACTGLQREESLYLLKGEFLHASNFALDISQIEAPTPGNPLGYFGTI
ncbi:hypothetical protein [Paenibacillus massiliensis]|uniref:hypothetical protein n=1 Tax=Paenibacillus massiliensis TaxID=225917 RepID=UPI0004B58975|nr:hypothetical protein [Paenibacillus massiliensis]